MSDALRKEYLEKTDEEAMGGAYAKTGYTRWLEESLLAEREKVKELTEIHENDEESIRALGRTFDREREKVSRLTAENERMREALVDANTDIGKARDKLYERETVIADQMLSAQQNAIERVLSSSPAVASPTVCRWRWDENHGRWDSGCVPYMCFSGKKHPSHCPDCKKPIVAVKEGEE